jgi:hypothetical protein
MKSRKTILTVIFVLFAIFVLIQFYPVNRDNGPVVADFNGDPAVKQILERSCYNCHSNETKWPWYSHVAPVSWLVASDVHEARQHFNFSNWQNMKLVDQLAVRRGAWKHVEEGSMPPGLYLLMHSDARLDANEKEVIHKWAQEAASEVIDSTGAGTEAEQERE